MSHVTADHVRALAEAEADTVLVFDPATGVVRVLAHDEAGDAWVIYDQQELLDEVEPGRLTEEFLEQIARDLTDRLPAHLRGRHPHPGPGELP